MYRRYYSVNDMPQMITNNKNEQKPQKKCDDVHIERKREEYEEKKLFGKLETDDIILIAIALLLLADDCDDKMLLIAIAFVFISGVV
jgi:hypothetical protein